MNSDLFIRIVKHSEENQNSNITSGIVSELWHLVRCVDDFTFELNSEILDESEQMCLEFVTKQFISSKSTSLLSINL